MTTPDAASALPLIPLPTFQYLLTQTYGILLIGTFVTCVLFGVVCLQIFLYYAKLTKDPIMLRSLPAFLVTMEFIHQILLCIALYKILINNFGNESVAIIIVPELFIASFFQGVIAFSAHLFYTYRIWRFSNGLWIVPCVTIPLTTVQLAMTFVNNILTLIHKDIAYIQTIAWTVYTTHGVNVFLDVFFVVAMIWLLKKERNSFSHTNSMIDRLIVLVVNTGLATAISTILTIIFVGALPNTFVYAFFNLLISPLYGNSVMANLNSRDYIRGQNHHESGLELSGIQFGSRRDDVSGSKTRMDSQQIPHKDVDGVTISKNTLTSQDYKPRLI